MNRKIKRHVKIGDKVKIISGNQKGFIGNIVSISIKKSTVIIDTTLPRIKFLKNREGGELTKLEIPISIHISNVMLWDIQANQMSKIGYKFINTQKKRYFKKSGNFV